MTERSTNAFFESLFNDYAFIMRLIREVKKKPELWDSSSPAYWSICSKQKREAQWIAITKALVSGYGYLYLKTDDIAVTVIKKKWMSLRIEYGTLIRRKVEVSSTCDASRFSLELQFLRPVIMSSKQHIEDVLKHPAHVIDSPLTELNAKIFYRSVFDDDIFVEVLIGEVQKRPILWDSTLPACSNRDEWFSVLRSIDRSFPTLDSKFRYTAAYYLKSKWCDLSNKYREMILTRNPDSSTSQVGRFSKHLEFLRPVIRNPNPKRKIPDFEATMEHVLTYDDITSTEQGSAAFYFPSVKRNANSFQQASRSCITELSSWNFKPSGNISSSSTISPCENNSLKLFSCMHVPNNCHNVITSEKGPASMVFPSIEQVSNSLQQADRSWIPDTFSRITAPHIAFHPPSILPSYEQNSTKGLSYKHVSNNFQPDTSSVPVFPPCRFSQGFSQIALPIEENVKEGIPQICINLD